MGRMNGWVAAMAIVAAGACAGCAAHASTTVPVGYAELYVGGTYAYYPHTIYQGRDVYFVGGRWIYETRPGTWVYYRVEPAPLRRYRMTVRQAPPAPRPAYVPPSAPSPVHRPAEPAPAPPATRVR